MVEVRLAIALVTDPSWDPVGKMRSLTYHGRDLGRYVSGPFPFFTKVVDKLDVKDKHAIFTFVRDAFIRTNGMSDHFSNPACITISYARITHGDKEGVLAIVFYEHSTSGRWKTVRLSAR